MHDAWIGPFIVSMFGHLAGDYLFQPKLMAMSKSKPGVEGFVACTTHVAIYTACVCLWLFWEIGPSFNAAWAAAVFVPHWLIDRFNFARTWLHLIRGRTQQGAKDAWDVSFTALVYTVVDNTFHALCLFVVAVLIVR